jgi:hypothetical protein
MLVEASAGSVLITVAIAGIVVALGFQLVGAVVVAVVAEAVVTGGLILAEEQE